MGCGKSQIDTAAILLPINTPTPKQSEEKADFCMFSFRFVIHMTMSM